MGAAGELAGVDLAGAAQVAWGIVIELHLGQDTVDVLVAGVKGNSRALAGAVPLEAVGLDLDVRAEVDAC